MCFVLVCMCFVFLFPHLLCSSTHLLLHQSSTRCTWSEELKSSGASTGANMEGGGGGGGVGLAVSQLGFLCGVVFCFDGFVIGI